MAACCVGFSVPIQAQFYAPETEYHDPSQRVFVVEAARVLAWWADPQGTNWTEIGYRLTTHTDHSSTWDLRWLDAAQKPIRTASVSYPAELLKAGPDFYRSVFQQLWSAGWKNGTPLAAPEVTQGFWDGAGKAGLSREESVAAALELAPAEGGGKPEREWLPQLAGLLVHASLPAAGDRVSLDSVLLARGAAWLAMAEQSTSARLDFLWATVLFQAGRERDASRLWQKQFPAVIPGATPVQAGWNIWLREPKSKEVYLYATEPGNLPLGMAMLSYDVKVNHTGPVLAELIGDMAGSGQALQRLHNFAPMFAWETSIGGGHILDGAWPVIQRMAWVRLLEKYRPSAHDYRGYLEASRRVATNLTARPERDPIADRSLRGLVECAPLLSLGHREGIGPLVPTPVVTARDLLNYGWEMTGLQMGRRYYFVRRLWGVPEQAEPILKTVTGELEGLMPCFASSKEANIATYRESQARLQLLDGYFPGADTETADDAQSARLAQAQLFARRAWLRPGNAYAQVRWLRSLHEGGEAAKLIERLHEEGGSGTDAPVLRYLESLTREHLKEIPRAEEWMATLAETLPEPTELYVKGLYNRKFASLDNFARAQALERLYWQNPDSQLEERIFKNYVVAGGFASARRFYSQARENLLDPVHFSNALGKTVYLLGVCQKDPKLRQMALEDSRSASYSDMVLHIWDAVVGDRPTELETNVKELVERYDQDKGVNSPGRRLLRFLPLVPALRDPAHPRRQEALRYFGKNETWVPLQWIWIDKYSLPAEDAIVFLGGRENDLFRQVIIAWLDKDQSGILSALNKYTASRNTIDERTVLAAFLYSGFHPLAPPHRDADLKPADASSVRKAVLARIQSTRK